MVSKMKCQQWGTAGTEWPRGDRRRRIRMFFSDFLEAARRWAAHCTKFEDLDGGGYAWQGRVWGKSNGRNESFPPGREFISRPWAVFRVDRPTRRRQGCVPLVASTTRSANAGGSCIRNADTRGRMVCPRSFGSGALCRSWWIQQQQCSGGLASAQGSALERGLVHA